jgi:DNA adenine methylase
MRGPLSYIGGKTRLASRIIERIPKHLTYVEPFAGGAQVFFHKEPSSIEVLNDLDGEVVNFYRVCQSHHDELVRFMRFMLLSREWFERLQRTPPQSLTDIQRAARYLYLQKVAFGGRVRSQSYGYFVTASNRFSPKKIPEMIAKSHERLAGTQIEHAPYEEVLLRYDRPTTFFYVDPPYYGVKLYRHNLEKSEFAVLRDRLNRLKGKFLLSLNDTPEVREIFSCFEIEEVPIYYSVQLKGERQHNEVLISNYTSRVERESGSSAIQPAKGKPQRAPPS